MAVASPCRKTKEDGVNILPRLVAFDHELLGMRISFLALSRDLSIDPEHSISTEVALDIRGIEKYQR